MTVDLPQEIVDKIIDEIADAVHDYHLRIANLRACSLVSSIWLHRSQKYLFQEIRFCTSDFLKWCKRIPPGENGPSRHTTLIEFRSAAGPTCSPDHISSFTNLQALHLWQISLDSNIYARSLSGLGSILRELLFRDCQIHFDHFVSFVQPFTNLERLRLFNNHFAPGGEIRVSDYKELSCFKGTLEFRDTHQQDDSVGRFFHQLSTLPSAFHTLAFWNYGRVVGEVHELLAASRMTLTRLVFRTSAPGETSLVNLDALEELKFSSLQFYKLPPVLRTVTSKKFENIQLFDTERLVNRNEDPKRWAPVDLELCALADRLQSARNFSPGGLRVSFVIGGSCRTSLRVVEYARELLPGSQKHRFISIY